MASSVFFFTIILAGIYPAIIVAIKMRKLRIAVPA
jgi:hypothetical protein